MSGIVGIYNLDGRPVDRADLTAMTMAIAHRGPDGAGQWVDGPIGLGHRMLRTTPEAVGESQPLLDDTGALCLTLDGRVDNREELLAALGPSSRGPGQDSDAALILRAYRQWGQGMAERIVGDFALALWDARRQELFFVRDFLGKRSFYYHLDRRKIRFASEPQAVLLDPSIPREPNEGMIGELLARRLTSTSETLFKHLLRLPPAHAMTVSPTGVRVRRYWSWDPDRNLGHQSDAEYAEGFLELFEQAVRVRLRSTGPVAAELSGGLDSSSVVSMVESLRAGSSLALPFATYSMVFPGRKCDESHFIDSVVSRWGTDSYRVTPGPVDAGPYEAQVARYLDLSDYPNGMMGHTHLRLATEHGSRVILTGQGGDEWLEGSYCSPADLLAGFRIRALIRKLGTARQTGMGSPLSCLLRYGVRPIVPPSISVPLSKGLGRGPLPSWLRRSFCRRNSLEDRIRSRRARRPTYAAADVAAWLDDGGQAHGNEIGERSAAWRGIEEREPFSDRRLVEYALALPDEQLRAWESGKYLLRHAMTGLVPEAVLTRPDAASFTHVFCEDLQHQGGERLFEDMTLASLGWVDGNAICQLYRDMNHRYVTGDPASYRNTCQLWLLVSIERWLRLAV